MLNAYYLYYKDNCELRSIEKNITLILYRCLKHLNLHGKSLDLTIVFTDDQHIKKLNNLFRNINKATDVLSFSNFSDSSIINTRKVLYLGDIVLSVDRIRKQAKDYNKSFKSEVYFLVLHGFLHLLGYNHDTKEEEKRMFDIKKFVLSYFGYL